MAALSTWSAGTVWLRIVFVHHVTVQVHAYAYVYASCV